MAKGDTKTNQYLDIAANGTRADLPTDTCCETRSQTLIREVAERIMDVEDEVEELKNNPDVVDIVATYADLQAYDTQHLTDKDIIRVLQDETHDGESTYYRYNKQSDTWTYVGTVGDYYTKTAADAKFQDKLTAGSNITISDQNVISATDTTYSNFTGTDGTTAGTAGLVPAPTTTDGDKYLKGDGTWGTVQAGSNYTAGDGINISAQDVISVTNTGKARELTTADYNWPTTGTKTSVALWLLPAGSYYAASTVSLAAASGLASAIFSGSPNVIVMGNDEYETKSIAVYVGNGKWEVFRVSPTSGGAQSLGNTTLAQSDISQSTGTSTFRVMSQNATTNAIKAISKSGSGAPSTSTVGTVGQLYQDTTNGKLYICTDATNPYVWEEVGAGGGGSGVVELTSADYNWPTNNPTGVAVWLLDEGIYSANGINIWSINTGVSTASDWLLVVAKKATISSGDGDGIVYHFPTGAEAFVRKGYRTDGSGATAVNMGVNVVQTAGNNQWDVMSQNAVTSMVYADPSTQNKICIGGGTANGSQAVAVGFSAQAGGNTAVALGKDANAGHTGSVALGATTRTSGAGQVNIGPSSTFYGYNNSQYRLLTGLYDGQSAHDAATYGQVISYSAINGAGAPTTTTEGKYVGQLYYDTTNEAMYFLKTIDTTTTPATYTWESLGGGSSVNVVQTTGTSTTDVMSQNAVTGMVFADPSTKEKVRIGSNSEASNAGGVSIGYYAISRAENGTAVGRNASVLPNSIRSVALGCSAKVNTNAPSAVAIGFGAYATQKGQFDISTLGSSSSTPQGYNSSNYRLLTGLYDPQSAHDAATKGYCDNAIINGGTTAPTTATVGAVGTQYTYVDTTGTHTAHLCVCTEIDTTDPSTPVYTWQTLI